VTLNPAWVHNPTEPDFISAVTTEYHLNHLKAEREALILKGYEVQRSRDMLTQLPNRDYNEQLAVANDNLTLISDTLQVLDTLIETLDKPSK